MELAKAWQLPKFDACYHIASVNNPELLDKALRLGEITTFEYFLEMSLYQNAVLHFLKTEWNYQAAVAELMRYRL